jgi:hypothetical protein
MTTKPTSAPGLRTLLPSPWAPLALGALLLALSPAHSASEPPPGAPPLTDQPRAVALPPAGTSVPLRRFHGKPVVDVRIDGRGPFALFLDTGGGATVLDSDFVAELGLPAIGTTKIGDPTDPEGIAAVQHRIERLEIADARFDGFFAVAFERAGLYRTGPDGEPAPRGVLGMPLFRDVLLTLDYPAGELRLSPGRLPPADGRAVVDAREAEAGLLGVTVKVAGQEYVMTLDSGAQGSITFPDELRTTLPLVAPAIEIGRGRTVAGEAIVYGAALDGAFELGAIRLERPDVHFFGRLTHGNLGSGFLARYAVSIDQRSRRLRFEPAATPPAAAGDATRAAGLPLTRYVGTYGERRITVEDGRLVLQRLVGPQGEGPKLALAEVAPHHFALAGQSEPRVKFVVSPQGEVLALEVQAREGAWETAPRHP